MWWGENVDREVKEEGVCRMVQISFKYMRDQLNALGSASMPLTKGSFNRYLFLNIRQIMLFFTSFKVILPSQI